MKLSFSGTFLTMTDILSTLARFDIMPEWFSLKSLREAAAGVSNFKNLIKFEDTTK